MENETSVSEQNTQMQVPVQVEANRGYTTKFNWGGLSLTFMMGIGNRAYLTLLILIGMVPFAGWAFAIFWMIWSGFHVEEWVLANPQNQYRDEAEFRNIMDSWKRAGFVAFIIEASVLVLYLLFFIFIGIAGLLVPTY
ncbi:MAG: hypothetical protein LBI11_06040 [Streptococcaceae bacterium]|jgi:hypothetical protein|nr:hypothetical protein [Streptococcaceae bacterium]